MHRNFREEDMYPAIRKYFEDLGYKVTAEVKDCDIVLSKDDTIIIIELKKSLSLDLFLQAAKRQKMADLTFMAVPRPRFSSRSKYRDIVFLIKRLSLGLIYVSDDLETLEIAVEPKDFDFKRSRTVNRDKLQKLKKEMSERVTDLNSGGQTGRPVMTRYREDCIRLLFITSHFGSIRPRDGVKYGISKTQTILRDNYYGWFINKARGIYTLTEEGEKSLLQYQNIKDLLLKDFRSAMDEEFKDKENAGSKDFKEIKNLENDLKKEKK